MATTTQVVFYQGTSSDFTKKDQKKDSDGIYFLSDTKEIYKGDTLYSRYVPLADTSTAGMVQPSSKDFVVSNGVVSLYTKMAISSFSVSNTTATDGTTAKNLVRGKSVSNLKYTYGLSRVPQENKMTVAGTTVTDITATSGTKTISLSPSWVDTHTVTISATGANGETATKTATLTFYNGLLCAASANTDTSSVLSMLSNGILKAYSSGAASVLLDVDGGTDGGKYVYLAIPEYDGNFQTPHIYANGVEGGFSKVLTGQSISGFTANGTLYSVYRTTNTNLGRLCLEVRP